MLYLIRHAGVGVSEERRRAVGDLVKKGVTLGSSAAYGTQWKKWNAFLATIPEDERPDQLLRNVERGDDKVLWLSLFISHLVKSGMRGTKEVSGVISGIRWKWHCEVMDSHFFDDPRIYAAKQGARPSTEEIRAAAERMTDNRKLPIFIEMIMVMRKQLYEESGLDGLGLYMKAVYLAAAFSFDMGLRPGNVRRRDGRCSEDHCLRAGDMMFLVMTTTNEIRIRGGEEIRSYLSTMSPSGMKIDTEKLKTVKGVDVSVVTTKTSHRGRSPIEAKHIGRGNVFEELLLEDTCEFMVLSGVKLGDPFCTRYAPSKTGRITRKVVTAKSLSEAVKEACREFKLPELNFSAKSLRSGFATHLASCGISREQMLTRGGWSTKSRVPDNHYIHRFRRGAFSTAFDDEGNILGLGVEGAKRMLPPDALLISRRVEI